VRADPRDAGEKRGHKEESLHGAYSVWAATHRNPGSCGILLL
jgi:hypothetical protein